MKVRVKYYRIFTNAFKTIGYDCFSKSNDLTKKYHFGGVGCGYEAVALWKIKLK